MLARLLGEDAHVVICEMLGADVWTGTSRSRPQPTSSDVPAGAPFFGEIEWAAAEGIVEGYPDGRFRPAATVTRQAAAAFLQRSR